MTVMFFSAIDISAVVVATVMSMGLGLIWYAPWVFGPVWKRSSEEKKEKDGLPQSPSWISYLASFVMTFISAYIIGALFGSLLVVTIGGMILVGVCMWAGFVLPVKLADLFYGREDISSFSVIVGYHLLSLVLMSVVIGVFSWL